MRKNISDTFKSIHIQKLLAILVLLTSVHLAESQTLSLRECINYALQNSNRMSEAGLSKREILTRIRQEKRFMLPEVKGYANFWQYLGNFPVYYFPEGEGGIISGGNATGRYPVQLGQPSNFMTGIELNQKLFDARFFQSKAIQEKAESLTELQLRKEQENTIYEITKVYLEIGLLQLNKLRVEQNQQRLSGIRKIMEPLVESGITALGDGEELTINENRLKLSLHKVENGIRQKTEYLKLLMGMSPDEQMSVQTNPDIAIPESTGVGQSANLSLIDSNIELNKSRLKLDNAGNLPYLDFYLKAQWQQQQEFGDLFSSNADWYNLHIAGLKLSIPILGNKQRKTREETTIIENEKLTLKRDLASRSEQLMLSKAYDDLAIATETVEILVKEVELREKQNERSKQRYEEGIESLRDLLDVNADLTSSQAELNQSILELEIAKLELLRAQNSLLLLAQ